MASHKISAKTEEEIIFMEHMLLQCDTLTRKIEEYASCTTKAADGMVLVIVRHLGHFRQQAMMKNLGPLADAAGTLGILSSRGAQIQRTRTMREGIINFKTLIERLIKAKIAADGRTRVESEKAMAAEKAAQAATPKGGD